MESADITKYLFYAFIPATAFLIYYKWNLIYSIRQRWLAKNVMSNVGTSKIGHGHVQGHSHSHSVLRFEELKKSLFQKLAGSEETSTILEIGVGPGSNFKYYPKKCKFIAVDPNPYFEDALRENLSKYPGIVMERRAVIRAEDMVEIPDNSVDAVIATFVFCQVNNVGKTFKEVLRILVPGGKFYYMDHIGIREGIMYRMLSIFLTYSGLARLIFNAHLNRDIGKIVVTTGFADLKQKYEISNNQKILMGIGTK